MDRGPHVDAIGGHGPADRASDASIARDRTNSAGSSYVESVLFGRRPRGSPPKTIAETNAMPRENAPATNEKERN
jgi:hypothetical protein